MSEKTLDVDGQSPVESLNDEEHSQRPKSTAEPPPNGGVQAWLQVAGSWALFFNSWGIVNSFGVFQTYYKNELLSSQSSSNIAWIGSIQACLLLCIGPLTGPLFDMGYFHALIRTGSFLVVFGMMMTSLCTEYYQVVLAQGICVGLGAGCLFIPSVAIVSTYFSTRKSLSTGLASTGSSIAGIVLPVVFTQLQPQIGFPWACRILGFISLGTLMIPLLVMKPRVLPPVKRALVDWSAIREPEFVLFAVGVFLGFTGLYIPFFYIPSYALSVTPETISPSLSIYLLAVLNGASIPGRIIPNFFADKTGPLTIISAASIGTCILAFGWLGIFTKASIIVFCIFYGFVTGSFVSLPPTCIASLSPSLGIIGTRMGMVFFISGLGVLCGSPVAGTILKAQGGEVWWGLKLFCALFTTLCAASFCAARVFKGGWSLRAKA